MWTHLPSVEEEHREVALQNSHAIPLSHYGPHRKGKAQTSNGLTIVHRDYPIGAHTVTRSTTHIRGSKIGVS